MGFHGGRGIAANQLVVFEPKLSARPPTGPDHNILDLTLCSAPLENPGAERALVV